MSLSGSQLIIRIDEKLKKQAQESADKFGLSLSALVKVLLKNVVNSKKVTLGDDQFDIDLIKACQDDVVADKLNKLSQVVNKKYATK